MVYDYRGPEKFKGSEKYSELKNHLFQYLSHRHTVGINSEQVYESGTSDWMGSDSPERWKRNLEPVSYTHLTLPTNREV